MVEEAEKYKNEDDAVKERIEAKNKMEEQIYQAKSACANMDSSVKDQALSKLNEFQEWHSNNQSASKEDYEAKMKEMGDFIGGLASSSNPTPPPPPEEQEDGPKIEEID